MIEYITSDHTLRSMAGKCLTYRCLAFNRKFKPTKISITSLCKIYKKVGIKRKKVVWKKAPTVKQKNKIQLMIDTGRDRLKYHIEKGNDIYFLDECCFTKNTY